MNISYEFDLCALIEKIETKYGVYIGTKTLTGLFYFLHGYQCCFYKKEQYVLHFLGEFQTFVEKKYQNHWDSWLKILLANSQEQAAFDSFYRLFRQFLNETEYGKQIRSM